MRARPAAGHRKTHEANVVASWELFGCFRCIHFLGGAFVSASPRLQIKRVAWLCGPPCCSFSVGRLFYQRFLEELAEQCEAEPTRA